MVWTILQVSLRRLKNNRSELLLTFVVPILFFSIFALIFGSRGSSGSSTPRIKIALSDVSHSPLTLRAVELLREQSSLRITDSKTALLHADSVESQTAETVPPAVAEDLVRRGSVSAAVVFSPPVNQPLVSSSPAPLPLPTIQLLSDSYDQVASQVLSALVQKAILTAYSESQRAEQERMMQQQRALGTREPPAVLPASFLSNHPNTAESNIAALPTASMPTAAVPTAAAMPALGFPEPPKIECVDILGKKKANPVIAMYAAGIAVMFLLFSATTASGSLLEERENSTLDRLLCSRLTMDQLLLGKWAYLTFIGMIQMTLMFTWGSLVFGIELLAHLEGFFAMTLITAGASSSFALFLASLCKTRTQLGWVSTIVILSMSALGGSMVPRYLMSESMQRAGLLTFNAWALEGYNKIFWRELKLPDIELELGVLTLCGFCFIVAARMFAVRWERT
jgi:ABC-2 type transport system permease protein